MSVRVNLLCLISYEINFLSFGQFKTKSLDIFYCDFVWQMSKVIINCEV